MKAGLTADTFARLLHCLDANQERAGEKYEDLRRTLIRFFEWRGAPFPEEHTDESFNRVARKLGEGIEIKNIGGYCYEVARLVLYETLKGPDRKHDSLEAMNVEVAAIEARNEAEEKEMRLACLDQCLGKLPESARDLIVEYYQASSGEHIERRKALAERLGLRREALANRVQRLRDKLEQCVRHCLKNKLAI